MLFKCVTDFYYSNYVNIVKFKVTNCTMWTKDKRVQGPKFQIFTWILHHPVIPHSDGMAAKHDDDCYVTKAKMAMIPIFYL